LVEMGATCADTELLLPFYCRAPKREALDRRVWPEMAASVVCIYIYVRHAFSMQLNFYVTS